MDTLLFWTALWVAGIGLFVYLMITLVRRLTIRFSQGVEANVRAAEAIVNDERVPEAWAAPYRQPGPRPTASRSRPFGGALALKPRSNAPAAAATKTACAAWTNSRTISRKAAWLTARSRAMSS